MNTSGGPVKQLMNAYGVDAEHLIVIHDELDIDPGTVRVKFGGGHAGHNGLRSICDKLGNARLASRARGHRAPAGTHARGGLGAVEAEEGRGRRLRPSHRPRRTGGVVAWCRSGWRRPSKRSTSAHPSKVAGAFSFHRYE